MKSSLDNDRRLARLLAAEYERQAGVIQLIASENYPTQLVAEVLRQPLLHFKTAEGTAGRRFHSGCGVIDQIEALAVDRAKTLFGAAYANVQPITATIANQAAFRAFCADGEPVLVMDVRSGGHISHNLQLRNVVPYQVEPGNGLIDYHSVAELARRTRPRVIVAGGSAYPREIDFAAFRTIADDVGAFLVCDIAHIAGFVAVGLHPSPVPHAHVTTGSTYKTLRGPRSGFLVSGPRFEERVRDQPVAKALDRALFPGVQGSPDMLGVAAKAACFAEASRPSFRAYMRRVRANSRELAVVLQERGYCVVTGGTDNHIVLVDLSTVGLTGVDAEQALEQVGILCNRNLIPGDTRPPQVASGIRFGTSFVTSRGMGRDEMRLIAEAIDTVLALAIATTNGRRTRRRRELDTVQRRIRQVAYEFPLYPQRRDGKSP